MMPTAAPSIRAPASRGMAGLMLAIAVLTHTVHAEPASDVTPLSFAAFFAQPVGPRGLAWSPTLLAADGRTVRIVGYMVAQQEPQSGRFQLSPMPVRKSEHADGDADDLPPATVTVLLDPAHLDRIVAHRDGPLALTGRLHVGRSEDAQGRVSWITLQLAGDALASSTVPTVSTSAR